VRPVSTRFTETTGQSHQVATLVEVLESGLVIAGVTTVVDGSVTLDQTAATRGRLDLGILDDGTLDLVPTDAASLLAPYGNELQIHRGILFPDGVTELVSLGVFRIDDTQVDDTADSLAVRIAGLDRSARIIDARFEEPYQIAQGTNYTTAIRETLQAAWPDIPLDLTATTRTTPQLIAEEGDDRWAFCQDMAAALGMALYFDGDGTAVTRPVAAIGGTPAATLAEGEGGVLIQASRRWTRQGSYNRVIATGENTGEAAPARGVATDDNPLSPTYYYGPFGKVPRFYSSQFITTDDQASDAAAGFLSRELGTTQSVDFGAFVNPALEPDDIVRVTRARAGINEDHIIDSLTIPLAVDGTMTGQTRATITT
jgi:hypothetical protein